MAVQIQAVRGMNDILPEESSYWQWFESIAQQVLSGYGYHEIRLPVVEKTALFQRGIGEVTDIVAKEMYSFDDRGGESITLRPEGTASCVRAALQHGLLHNQQQKLWYLGPMFRYERPQKGRQRQFYQLGAEAFGFAGPQIDVEMILLSASLLRQVGVLDHVTLQLNSLGNSEERQAHRAALVDYLEANRGVLDEDSVKRLAQNPLRILDSKNPQMQDMIAKAPRLLDFLQTESRQHLETVEGLLQKTGVAYEINPCLVRGLDYYSRTVFEWVSTDLGAQATVCAGGRYDGLVEQFGGKSTPAIGFALGIERLLLLIDALQKKPQLSQAPHIYCISEGGEAAVRALQLAEKLRAALPQLRIISHGDGQLSFKNQFKKANKAMAEVACVIGEQECADNSVTLKYLQQDRPQETHSSEAVIDLLTTFFTAN